MKRCAGTGSVSESHVLGSSVGSTPAGSAAGGHGSAALEAVKGAGLPEAESAPGGDAAAPPDWEPRTPVASPAKPRRHVVGIKLVPMAVSSNDSTPRAVRPWQRLVVTH
jgi:hypothetical protein